jgi:hypothetical protein
VSRPDFEPLAWAKRGIPRDEAGLLWAAGLELAEAADWRARYGTDDTLRWRAADVLTLREARSWLVAGVGASDVADWRAAGIGFAEAAAWHEFGYSLADARELKAKGKSPSEAFRHRVQRMRSQPKQMTNVLRSWSPSGTTGPPRPMQQFISKLQQGGSSHLLHGYFHRQWFDDDAVCWAEQGIDAADAKVWLAFGIGPAEAAALERAGATAAGTMRAWWEAGIPPDEVAAWIGAGLTADEAAAQRAAGVTAERASVLRALRDPAGPD